MSEQLTAKTVVANGAEFHYIERGSGDPVIFVHGSLGDFNSWTPQLELFAQRYRVIAYSRRYHSPNIWKGGGTDYSAALHADDLVALIEALGISPVHAVGNSFGAYTILVAAIRRPELFRKLVLGEPPILPWIKQVPGGQAVWDDFMKNAWEPATRAFEAGEAEKGVRLFIDGVSGGPGSFDRAPEPTRRRMLVNARSLAAETSSPGYYTEVTPQQIEQITLPMLLLRGENSPKMFHMVMDKLAECAPNARQVTIPNASHSMPSNNPAVYNQVVMEFLG